MNLTNSTYARTSILLIVGIIAFHLPARAQVFTILHGFNREADGAEPWAGLIQGKAGDLLGTTEYGGDYHCHTPYNARFGCGTVFKVTTQATGSIETVLHAFAGGAEGARPQMAGLVQDAAGNLYGTTTIGGNSSCNAPYGCGVVFKLDKTGNETVLHTFTGGSDGYAPVAGVILDANGNLYGTAAFGGDLSCNAPTGCGTVFKVDNAAQVTVLHTFVSGVDGAFPETSLIEDSAGNLYGTTMGGGGSPYCGGGCGVVFKVDQTGNETLLHVFDFGSGDGAFPQSGLAQDKSGSLYGSTASGGAFGLGTVFKVNSGGGETVLYSFSGRPDGDHPSGNLILDPEGNLYGTTESGGDPRCGCGTVFKVDMAGYEAVLHRFTGRMDGSVPYAGLVLDGKTLYGTAPGGGPFLRGLVFTLSP